MEACATMQEIVGRVNLHASIEARILTRKSHRCKLGMHFFRFV